MHQEERPSLSQFFASAGSPAAEWPLAWPDQLLPDAPPAQSCAVALVGTPVQAVNSGKLRVIRRVEH